MKLSKYGWCMFGLVLMLGSACDPLTPEERAFVELSYDDQIRRIISASCDEKLELYFLAYRMVPPNDGAKRALAELGGEILPEVLSHLQESDDRSTRNLIDLLIAMEIQRSYCVSCDDAAMSAVREAVQRMQNDTSRKNYAEKIDYFLEAR